MAAAAVLALCVLQQQQRLALSKVLQGYQQRQYWHYNAHSNSRSSPVCKCIAHYCWLLQMQIQFLASTRWVMCDTFLLTWTVRWTI